MRRGKTGVLFRYLPECVVDYTDAQTIGKVAKWQTKEAENINKLRFIEKIEQRIKFFSEKKWFPSPSSTEDYIFLEPEAVEIDVFPLTFSCKKCRRVHSFSSVKDFRNKTKNRECKCDCGGRLEQLDMIHYHECGKIESLRVQKCGVHGDATIILNKYNSDSLANWRWECLKCGKETGRVTSAWCSDCGRIMKTAPFRKSQVFYPWSVSLINILGENEELIYKSKEARGLIFADYLGLLKEQTLENLLKASEKDSCIQQEDFEKKIQDLIKDGLPSDYIEKVRRTFQKTSLYEKRKEILNYLEKYINKPRKEIEEEEMHEVATEIYEYLQAVQLENKESFSDVINKARETNNPRYAEIKQFPDAVKKIGIARMFVFNDLPIATGVFGYTRGSIDRGECVLRSFEKQRNKTPVYTVSSETEGIIIELDKWKVLKWLEKNGAAVDIPSKGDEFALKAWFINNVRLSQIPEYDEIPPDAKITKMVYKLTHSISHVLLKHASSLIGLDKNSLAEMILPNIPAIIIYSNNIQHYQLGGFFSLFESNIIPWVEVAEREVQNCIYDPVCLDTGGACHYCLHLSEISCVHFNRDLGRDVLIGKKMKNQPMVVGFWEDRFIKSLKEA